MPFQKGNQLAKKGASARNILRDLCDIYQDNRQLMKDELTKELQEEPTKFFRTYLQGIIPKNIEISGDEEQPLTVININKYGPDTNKKTD